MEFTTVLRQGEAEFVEKKSRFIGKAYPVESEEEVRLILEEVRKECWDATHNCFAYRVGVQPEVQRFSDDGEPGGTAGMPMLEVLRGQNVQNVLVIVTRYFGGVLLGTGGLVRAYTKGTQLALEAAGVIRKEICHRYLLPLEYTQLGKVQYTLAKEDYPIEDTEYTNQVLLTVNVPERRRLEFLRMLRDTGEGRWEATLAESLWGARQDKNYIFFPDSTLAVPQID